MGRSMCQSPDSSARILTFSSSVPSSSSPSSLPSRSPSSFTISSPDSHPEAGPSKRSWKRKRHKKSPGLHHGNTRDPRDGDFVQPGLAGGKFSPAQRPTICHEESGGSLHGCNAAAAACCSECAAGLVADCTAVCCCPVALIHLAGLAFIKLPCVLAWRTLVRLKKGLCRRSSFPCDGKDDDGKRKQTTPRQNCAAPWSCCGSPNTAETAPGAVQLVGPSLWEHFDAGSVGFGAYL